jgi:hypothetical protein
MKKHNEKTNIEQNAQIVHRMHKSLQNVLNIYKLLKKCYQNASIINGMFFKCINHS